MNPSKQGWLALAAILALFVVHARFLGFVNEDAYITFRFAMNLAQGDGLVWNVGQERVEGYTNFLWVVLSAAAHELSLDLPLFAQLLGTACGIVTLLFAFAYAHNVMRMSEARALLAAGLLAVAGPMACWAASGMETSLFGMWVMIACYCAARFARTRASRWLWLAASALLGAALTRPEGVFVFGLIGLFLLVYVGDDRSPAWWRMGIPAMAFAVPFALYFLWRFDYFGYPFPNTFYAKTGGGTAQKLRGLGYVAWFAVLFVLPLLWMPLLYLWQRRRSARAGSATRAGWLAHVRRHGEHYLLAWIGACYSGYVAYVGGDYMSMYRFLVPILPLIYLLFVLFLDRALRSIEPAPGRRLLVITLSAVSAAAIALQSTPLEEELFYSPPANHGTYRGVVHERQSSHRFELIGEFFAEYRRNDSESLETNAIGAIAYFSGMPVYGRHGLVSTEIAHGDEYRRRVRTKMTGHERDGILYNLSLEPTFVMFSRNLEEEPEEWPRWRRKAEALEILERDYVLQSVRLEDRENGESGFFTFAERKDRGATEAGRGR